MTHPTPTATIDTSGGASLRESVNEPYACLEDGAFGPIGPLLASDEAVEWAEAQRQADLKGIAR